MTTDTWQTIGLTVLAGLFYVSGAYFTGALGILGNRVSHLEKRLSDAQRQLNTVHQRSC